VRLYIDSIVKNEIVEAMGSGFVYGVTSNPFLFNSNSKVHLKNIVEELIPYVGNEFHVQVPGRDSDEYVKNALTIFNIDPKKLVIKIPMHSEGVKAMKVLKDVGVRVTATAVTNVVQGVVAALLGVDYVAPFVSRVDEAGYNGVEVVRQLAEVYRVHRVKTMIIAASIRTPTQLVNAFRAGADCATVKYSLFKSVVESATSNKIISQMNEIWRGVSVE
jgi:transaldolase